MATHGKFALFRMENTLDTEDTLTDKIEFSGDRMVPDNKGGIVDTDISPERGSPDNPLPFTNLTDKQDTGLSGNTYSFTAFFNEKTGISLGIAKLRNWSREEQTIDDKFEHGRIGIRNDRRPEFNLTPDNTSGYKLMKPKIITNWNRPNITFVQITLIHSGDPSRWGL